MKSHIVIAKTAVNYSRKNVLSSVLLHVAESVLKIYHTMNGSSFRQSTFQDMSNNAIFYGYIINSMLYTAFVKEHTLVAALSSLLWEKSCLIKAHKKRAIAALTAGYDSGIKFL